jgi:alkylation response protein AidB-like acyl-CoA dehydrogenase
MRCALGLAKGSYELALAYVQQREQFGRPICEFQGIQWMLADMATGIAAAEALIYRAAGHAGNEFPDATEAAQAKIFTSEMAIKVTRTYLKIV